MIGPWTVISGITTVAMLPPAVDGDTRRRAVGALSLMAEVHTDIARAIRRADGSREARAKLDKLVVAMGRVIIAAREMG